MKMDNSLIKYSAAIVTIVLISASVVLANNIAPSYGPPFYNSSKYSYGGHPSNTVDGAISNWWTAYQAYWHVACSYNLTRYDDGTTTGYFASMKLTKGCGGGDSILGTAFCPTGFTLKDSMCQSEVDSEKNFGKCQ